MGGVLYDCDRYMITALASSEPSSQSFRAADHRSDRRRRRRGQCETRSERIRRSDSLHPKLISP
jgi:hypothetical protein